MIDTPLKLGSITLKNRFVVASTYSNNTAYDDFVGPNLINAYEREGAGGAALVIVQPTYVHPQGRGGFPRRLGIHHKRCINGLEELASIIQRGGAKAAVQLQHARFKSPGDDTPGGESAGFDQVSEEAILTAIEAFGQAAARAQKAGFDAVEVHACHGSFTAQFFSPIINQRNDKWGQDRPLFALSVLKSIREQVGRDFPVIIRLSATEGTPEGFGIEDTLTWVKRFEDAGADAIHVSNGSRTGLDGRAAEVMPLYWAMGNNLQNARAVKEKLSIPVIGVGKIMTPSLAREALAKGHCDLIGLSRPIISDPDFPNKAIQGREKSIRKCIGCNYCYRRVAFEQLSIRCAINPQRGREKLYAITPAHKPKKVLVVGGGPAGMEAARVAAERGHQVELWEKDSRLGGQINLALALPRLLTANLGHLIQYHEHELERLGVTVRLKHEATVSKVLQHGADRVVLAAGAKSARPDLPGIGGAPVVTQEEALTDLKALDKRIVVLGGAEGAELAVGLARSGHEVSLVHPGAAEEVGFPVYIHDRFRSFYLQRYLEEEKVQVLASATELAFAGNTLRFTSQGSAQELEADHFVLALGRVPTGQLSAELSRELGPALMLAGDCVEPRSLVEAVDDGAYAGRCL